MIQVTPENENPLILFAVDNDVQRLSFWKIFTRETFPGKKTDEVKNNKLEMSTLLTLPPDLLQEYTNAFKNLLIYVRVLWKQYS